MQTNRHVDEPRISETLELWFENIANVAAAIFRFVPNSADWTRQMFYNIRRKNTAEFASDFSFNEVKYRWFLQSPVSDECATAAEGKTDINQKRCGHGELLGGKLSNVVYSCTAFMKLPFHALRNLIDGA